MFHALRPAVTLLMVSFLAGCAITEHSAQVSDELLVREGQPVSYLVGSIGPDSEMSAPQQYQRLLFRQRGSEWGAAAAYTNHGVRQTPQDIEEGQGRASVFVMALKPGDYELYDFQFFSLVNTGYGTYSTSQMAREKFVVPLRLQPGKAYYIGEYRSRCLTSTVCLFIQRDRQARDEGIARAQVPQLPSLEYLPLPLERARPFILPEKGDTQEQTKDRATP